MKKYHLIGVAGVVLGLAGFIVGAQVVRNRKPKPPKATQLTASAASSDDFQIAFPMQPFDRQSVEGAVYELQMTVKPKPGVSGGVQTYYFDKDCKFLGYGRFHTIPNPD